jgi:hypothetical protein
MLITGGMVYNASYAAFSATTTNPGNSWSTGTVAITNDQNAAAVFTVNTAKPDTTLTTLTTPPTGAYTATHPTSGGSACIKVTYTGTTTADIKLYATLTNTGADGGLGQFLLFTIDTGTNTAPTTDPTCATYTSTTYLHGTATNTNTTLNTIPTTYNTGLTGTTGATNNTSKWYRLSWLLPANVTNTAQNEQVQATFTWEAQNA